MSLNYKSNIPSVSDNNTSFLGNDQSGNKGQDLEPSNTADNSKPGRRARFTRGEICLFIHLIVTLVLLLLLVIVYVVHLFVVNHHGDNIFVSFLRSGNVPSPKQADYLPVGLVFVVPSSYMCNCLLLSARWSAAPAHCAAARSDPDLVHALPNWRIMYGKTSENLDTEDYLEIQIKRSVVHPHFNRDDFKNNIGLFEHENPLNLLSYPHISGTSLTEITMKYEADLKLIGWEDSWHLHGHVVQNPVQPLLLDNCKQYVSSIVELRPYEHCVTLKLRRNVSIIPGAALAMKSNYVGLFSWGESRGRAVPFVILDLAHYKSWIQHILTL